MRIFFFEKKKKVRRGGLFFFEKKNQKAFNQLRDCKARKYAAHNT